MHAWSPLQSAAQGNKARQSGLATQLHQSTGHSTATHAVHSEPKSLQMVWPELELPPSPTLPPSPALPATFEPPLLLLLLAEIELAPPAEAPPESEVLSEPPVCRSTLLAQPNATESRNQVQVDFTSGLSAFRREHTRRRGFVRRLLEVGKARTPPGVSREPSESSSWAGGNSSMISKIRSVVVVASMLTLAVALPALAGNVTETKSECSSARAILLGGTGDNAPAERIRNFASASRLPIEVTVVSWELAYPGKSGTTEAVGVRCKSGSDCNSFAKAFAAKNPDSSPLVFCGETTMLKNERDR